MGWRWRVQWGTREGKGADWHNDSSLQSSTHSPSRQHAGSNPPPAFWQCAWEWQGDIGSFFMCCSSTPLQSNCKEHLCFTTHQRLTGRQRSKTELRSDINHSLADNCCQMLIAFWLSSNSLFHCLCLWKHMLIVKKKKEKSQKKLKDLMSLSSQNRRALCHES